MLDPTELHGDCCETNEQFISQDFSIVNARVTNDTVILKRTDKTSVSDRKK